MASQPQQAHIDDHSQQPSDTQKVANRNVSQVPVIIVQEAPDDSFHSSGEHQKHTEAIPQTPRSVASDDQKESQHKDNSPSQSSHNVSNVSGINTTGTGSKTPEHKVEEGKAGAQKGQEANQQQSQQVRPSEKVVEQGNKQNEQLSQSHVEGKSETKSGITQDNKSSSNNVNPKDEKKVEQQVVNKEANVQDKMNSSNIQQQQQQNVSQINQAVVPREQLLQHQTAQNQDSNPQKQSTTVVPAQVSKTTTDNLSPKDSKEDRKTQDVHDQKQAATGVTNQSNQSAQNQPQSISANNQTAQQKDTHNTVSTQPQNVAVNPKDTHNASSTQPQNVAVGHKDNQNSGVDQQKPQQQAGTGTGTGTAAGTGTGTQSQPQQNPEQGKQRQQTPKVVPAQDNKAVSNNINTKDEKKPQETQDQKSGNVAQSNQVVNTKPQNVQGSAQTAQPVVQNQPQQGSELDKQKQLPQTTVIIQEAKSIINNTSPKDEKKSQEIHEQKPTGNAQTNQSVNAQPQSVSANNQTIQQNDMHSSGQNQDSKIVRNNATPPKEEKKIQEQKSGGMILGSSSQFVGSENKPKEHTVSNGEPHNIIKNEVVSKPQEHEEDVFTHRNTQQVLENTQKEHHHHNYNHHHRHHHFKERQNSQNMDHKDSRDRKTMERIPSDHSEGYYGYREQQISAKSKSREPVTGKRNIFRFPEHADNYHNRSAVQHEPYKHESSHIGFVNNVKEKGHLMHRDFSLGNEDVAPFEPKFGTKENHGGPQGDEYYPVITSDLFGQEGPKSHHKSSNEHHQYQKREVSPGLKMRKKNDIEEHIRQHKIQELKKNKKTLEDKLMALDEQLFELEKADQFNFYTSPRKISYDKYKQEKKEELLEKKRQAQEFAKRMHNQKREMEMERQRRRDLKENQLLRELGALHQKQKDELELLKMEERGKSNLEKELEKVRDKYNKQDANMSALEEKKKELKGKRDFSMGDNADRSYNHGDDSRDRSAKSRNGKKRTMYKSPILNRVLKRDEEQKLVDYEKMKEKRDLYEKRLEYGREVKATFLPRVRVFDYERRLYGGYNAQNIELHMQGYMAKAYVKKPEPVHRYQSKMTNDSFSKEPAEQEMNIKTNYSKGVGKNPRHYAHDEDDQNERGSQSNLDQEDVSYYKKSVKSYTGRERNQSVQPQRKLTSDMRQTDYSRVRVGDVKGHNISMDQRYYEDENMDLKHQLQNDQLILREKIGTMLSDIKKMELQIKQKEELLIKDIERKQHEIEY